MQTYVINLDRRPDRMIEVESARIPFPYERFPATDGSIFLENEPNKYMRGHLGCHDSHLRLLKKIRQDGHDFALVLEDDVQFVKHPNLDLIFEELPDDWDLLYLGGRSLDKLEPYSPMLERIKGTMLQTHAYVINRKFLDTLIDTLENRKYKVDIVFSDAIPKGNCFITKPRVAFQRNNYSDITHR